LGNIKNETLQEDIYQPLNIINISLEIKSIDILSMCNALIYNCSKYPVRHKYPDNEEFEDKFNEGISYFLFTMHDFLRRDTDRICKFTE